METDRDDTVASFKALGIFQTMNSNLAMLESFTRRSVIEPENYDGADLGFIGMVAGAQQIRTHNRAVVLVSVSLLYQAFENYWEMKRVSPRLEFAEVESFLDGIADKAQFIDGMRRIRNGVFHVTGQKSWRHRSIKTFYEVCGKLGGPLAVVARLRDVLYRFTDKCLVGDLKVFPLAEYEYWKRMEKEHPEELALVRRGEIDLIAFLEVTRASVRGSDE